MQFKKYVFCLVVIGMFFSRGNYSRAQAPAFMSSEVGAMAAEDSTPVADISLGTVSVTDGTFSNHNLLIDPGEIGNIVITLNNPSLIPATDVHGSLSIRIPVYVTVINDSASFGNIQPSSSASNASAAFSFALRRDVPCGTRLDFAVHVSFGDSPTAKDIVFSVFVGTRGNSFAATLGSPVSGNGYNAITGKQRSRLMITTPASNCLSNKLPGALATDTIARQFDAYTFSNPGPGSTCVNVSLQPSAGAQLSSVTYNRNGFFPQRPDANYLADIGPALAGSYSFNVAAGQSFTVVVYEIDPGAGNNPNYTLTVSVPTCSPGPACSPVVITTAEIATGETGKPYLQSFGTAGGSGSYDYTFKGDLPAGISFNGNVLSGTPTQAGRFPFLVSSTDNICGRDTNAYTLVVDGEVASHVLATAGTVQETSPYKEFPVQLQATVLNSSGVPMPGVNVIFSAPGRGPSASFRGNTTSSIDTSVTVKTDSKGIATAPVLTANSTAGSYQITAKVTGVATPAIFNLSNTCPSNLIVTSNADSGPGSLRDIISNACNNQVITFDSSIHQITLTTGELIISRFITIAGPGADKLTISGNHLSRVFNVSNYVTISGLTIRDGKTKTTDTRGGGGILINGGEVYIKNCHITNNDVSSSVISAGGGIEIVFGLIYIENCSITGNKALLYGGGIVSRGMTAIYQCTITENSAGLAGYGGGLASQGLTSVWSSTFFGNSAGSGGNVYRFASPAATANDYSTVFLRNTIIAGGILLGTGGTGADIGGSAEGQSGSGVKVNFQADGVNLVETTEGAILTGTVPQIFGLNPKLLPLGNYGGTMPVLLPQPNSAAINTGDPRVTSGTDQRGFPRVSRLVADIGAVEANYATTVISGTPQTSRVNMPFRRTLRIQVSESGKVVRGVALTFSAPPNGASGTFPGPSLTASDTTNARGIAASPEFTANGTTGSYHVSGKIGLAFDSIIYHLTNRRERRIRLAEISGSPGDVTTTLSWEADDEANSSTFTVEYSTTGKTFQSVGSVPATGIERPGKAYRFTHATEVKGILYYRIKQSEPGSEEVYSNVVRFEKNTRGSMFMAFPNPVRTRLTIVIPGTGRYNLMIDDAAGQRIKQMNMAGGSHGIDAAHWAAGLYTITVLKDGKQVEVLKVIKSSK